MHITDRIQISVLKNISICDLLRFLRILHISICFGSKYYGYPDFSVRIETNNK